jgi:hypothetical protein
MPGRRALRKKPKTDTLNPSANKEFSGDRCHLIETAMPR